MFLQYTKRVYCQKQVLMQYNARGNVTTVYCKKHVYCSIMPEAMFLLYAARNWCSLQYNARGDVSTVYCKKHVLLQYNAGGHVSTVYCKKLVFLQYNA